MALETFEGGTPGDLITTSNTGLNYIDPPGAVFADTPLGRGRDGTTYAASPVGGDVPFQIGYTFSEVQAGGAMSAEMLIDTDTIFNQSRTLCGMWYFNGTINLPAVIISAEGIGQTWAGWLTAHIGDTPNVLLTPYSFDEWYTFGIAWDSSGGVSITVTNVDGAETASASGSVTSAMVGNYIGHYAWVNAPANPTIGGCHTPVNFITVGDETPPVAEIPPVRMYPRDDKWGISPSARIYPPPTRTRLFGGYQ